MPFALDTVFIENSSKFRLIRFSEFNLNKKIRDKQWSIHFRNKTFAKPDYDLLFHLSLDYIPSNY